MPISDPVTGEIITEAWGDEVKDAIAALEAADTAHAAAGDPHPVYTTAAELAAYAQPLDADLTSIAAVATTAYGRALLALANQAALMALIDYAETADLAAIGVANDAGASTELPRADHVHKGDFDGQVIKGANEDVTNSAALQNDDALTFATTLGTNYWIEIFLLYELQSGSAADLKVALGEDAVTRGMFHAIGLTPADAAQDVSILADQTATVSFGGTGNARLTRLVGTYRGGGGNFVVKWAQNTATAGVYTRMKPGSLIRWRAFS